MCRNIRTLFNFEPPATESEIRAAAVQFVRKVSGSSKPSQANSDAFDQAIDEISAITTTLLRSLVTTAEPKNREVEAAKAKARNAKRFA
jgi:hypothetical protein